MADLGFDVRNPYPEFYSKLASLTFHHDLAWDICTVDGKGPIHLAQHYDRVIATGVHEPQQNRATPHPKVVYHHTPPSMTNQEVVELIGGDNSVDLITVSQAVHEFHLPNFYELATRLLRKPGGVIVVWGYQGIRVNSEFDAVMKRTIEMALARHPHLKYDLGSYKTLPFPFEDVGLGSEGKPVEFQVRKTMPFEVMLRMLKDWFVHAAPNVEGIDLMTENVVRELESAWGGSQTLHHIFDKAFVLAGRVRISAVSKRMYLLSL